MSGRPTDVDPLVVPFLHAADETCARERLGELLMTHASAVVGPIIQRQLAFSGVARRDHEREDLQSTVLLRLTAQLWALRRDEAATPIVSLSAYAATAAYNACHEWLRRRAPRRASVQSRARYVLTHDPRLTIWEVADRDWWCAALDAGDRAIAAAEDHVRDVAGQQLAALRRAIDGGGDPSTSPRAFAACIRATLDALQRPCRFVTLVTVLADCLGEVDLIAADEAERGDGARSPIEGLPDPTPTAADALAHRDALVRLWEEIQALPLRQRVALLLNLRDDEGCGTIELWPQTGVASIAELAAVLEITEAQLREIWPTLPRDDQWIAEQVGITRRQVINLRKCARERLARRLRDVFVPAGGDRDSNSPPGSNGEPNGTGEATKALHRQFETTLARAAQEEEPRSFPDVTAYVDGMLDDVDREILETWLESDPMLRGEVEELSALRDAMRQAVAAPASMPALPARGDAHVGRETANAPAGADIAGAGERSATATAHRAHERPAPSVPSPVRVRRAATRSALSFWMFASLATAGAAAIVIFAVTWWKGAPSASPPASTQAGGSAPPPASGAGSGSAPSPSPSSTPPPASAPATAAILIRDAGRIITVDTGGRMSGLPDAMSAKADMVSQALREGTLPGAAAHKGLGQRELTLMGGAGATPTEALAVLAPIGTVVRETQPTFRWSAHPGARAYVITIYSASFDVVIASPPVRDTTWKATTALKPGAMYLWQVTANTPEGRVHAPTPPAADARFRVIDEAAARALERDLASAGSSRLLAGLLFADAGLLDDAEQAFTALANENPGSEPITRLLTRVRERRGQE